ncbi:MAG: hypothetical protein JXP37_01830 [Coriobacteriia bacterium]|nr:hypothetical protein [Coriobacteriia bacterium]
MVARWRRHRARVQQLQREAVAVAQSPFNKICMHCGAEGSVRLGYCSECNDVVCDRCGNTQLSMGQVRVIHDTCLKHAGESSFSMIKFVQ